MPLKSYFKIPLIYFVVGATWILISDRVVATIAPSMQDVIVFQTIKGWAYILITTLLLWIMVKRHHDRMIAASLERQALYYKAIEGSHHILLNYLNKMQLVTIEAENSKDFDKSVLNIGQTVTDEAASAIKALGDLPEPTMEAVHKLAYRDLEIQRRSKQS
ncbi:hypothetical protein [Coraliomargarita parva]|uniref:hypothetical protein n=1 Tax=Coraliomargarita parva TaxID=3014050 RepID=UPI0022B39467|nr:hypothetical protein [Coraliomargarita parva]